MSKFGKGKLKVYQTEWRFKYDSEVFVMDHYLLATSRTQAKALSIVACRKWFRAQSPKVRAKANVYVVRIIRVVQRVK